MHVPKPLQKQNVIPLLGTFNSGIKCSLHGPVNKTQIAEKAR